MLCIQDCFSRNKGRALMVVLIWKPPDIFPQPSDEPHSENFVFMWEYTFEQCFSLRVSLTCMNNSERWKSAEISASFPHKSCSIFVFELSIDQLNTLLVQSNLRAPDTWNPYWFGSLFYMIGHVGVRYHSVIVSPQSVIYQLGNEWTSTITVQKGKQFITNMLNATKLQSWYQTSCICHLSL